MPCYNHAHFVAESVAAILGQTFGDLELIVVDDNSSDGSVELLRELEKKDARLKFIVHDCNHGASCSRNDGLRAARGDFVAFCDADDLWKPDKLECQIAHLTEHKDCDVAYCDSEIIDTGGHVTGELFSNVFPLPTAPSGDLFEVLCARNFINMTTVLARRQALGGRLFFDESIQWVEDWWQWIRLSRWHRFFYEPRALALYRVHQQSTGFTQKPGISRNRWKVGKRNLRAHGDMPLRVQAVIWHQMGRELCFLGKSRYGCRFLSQAVRCGWAGGLQRLCLARMSARLGLEWSRRAMLQRH
jgi:glycosyltransferase involved in cell wall biosynthesis